ncbi:unnamed protein product, partial [Phaeothamnion confervicola]
MLYHRGAEADYEAWGVPGWGAADVLPYFLVAEGNRDKPASEYHSATGPCSVENPRYQNKLTHAFFEACAKMGLQRNDDFNDWAKPQDGFGPFQLTTRRGRRCSVAVAYLREAVRRRNLTVRTQSRATKVLTEDGRAVGVEYVEGGERRTARVAEGGEVLLAGGAVHSPQLLMLSGIGPADHLRSKGIPVVSDVPGVGANLMDHPAVTAMWDISRPVAITDHLFRRNSTKLRPLAVARWLLTGRGPLASPGCDNGGFFRSSPELALPDIQLRFVPGRAEMPDGVHAYSQIGAKGQLKSGVTVQVIAIRPQCRGQLSLRSADPFDKPMLTLNYLRDRDGADMETLRKGLQLARDLIGQASFGEIIKGEVFPGTAVENDAALDEYIRGCVHSANAVVGTCRMGSATDADAVVDPSLRVRGVRGLRVVDASVMPALPGGQTGAPTVMIAEKGADLVLGRAA